MGTILKRIGLGVNEPGLLNYQPVDFCKFCYFKDNIIITFNENRIESIEFNVPHHLKEEVKKNGSYLIRY